MGSASLDHLYLVEVLVVVIGATLQGWAFKNLHSNWPECYFYVQDQPSDYWISRHPMRYLTFRLGPGFVVCLLAGWLLASLDRHILLPCVLIGAAHWALSSGRRLFQIIRKQGRWRVSLPIGLHAVLLPTLTISSVAGAIAGHWFSDLAAKAAVLAPIILTAAYPVVVGRWRDYIGEGQMSEEDIFHRSKLEIPLELWHYAQEQSEDRALDPLLIQAVMIVENIQRPAWFRTVEKAVGFFMGRGSYGIMQVQAEHPLNDRQTIEIATTRLAEEDRDFDRQVGAYNGSPQFYWNVERALLWLQQSPDAAGGNTPQAI